MCCSLTHCKDFLPHRLVPSIRQHKGILHITASLHPRESRAGYHLSPLTGVMAHWGVHTLWMLSVPGCNMSVSSGWLKQEVWLQWIPKKWTRLKERAKSALNLNWNRFLNISSVFLKYFLLCSGTAQVEAELEERRTKQRPSTHAIISLAGLLGFISKPYFVSTARQWVEAVRKKSHWKNSAMKENAASFHTGSDSLLSCCCCWTKTLMRRIIRGTGVRML